MRKKILVVEDHFDSCDMLSLMYEIEGFETVCAKDGLEGFDLALKEDPDLIVTDLEMPNSDGIELIQRLRRESKFEAMPIIVLTAYHDETLSKALEVGANVALTKPVRFDLLYDLTVELLKSPS
jgi:two-component system alkaline phosphatase synthesis response regulator PhoP